MSKSKISFKSVGELTTNPKFRRKLDPIPFSPKLPLRLGENEIFEMNTNIEDQISNNIKVLLLTNAGERLGRFSYGANLRELTLEFGRDDFDAQVITRIKRAITKFMPYVEPIDLISEVDHFDNQHTARVRLTVIYDVPALGIKNKALEISFFVAG